MRSRLFVLAMMVALAMVAIADGPTCVPEEPGVVDFVSPIAGCSPGIFSRRAPEAARAGCVLVRALTDDGTVHDVCAAAEDLAPLLAPLVDLLISEHKDARDRGARVAFALPVATVSEVTTRPSRKRPRRKCVQWVYLDAGATDVDAGAEDDASAFRDVILSERE